MFLLEFDLLPRILTLLFLVTAMLGVGGERQVLKLAKASDR